MEELPESAEPQHEKPLLAVEEQIAHLKSKGITFDLCGEAEAATILAKQNNYLCITSYRQLFDRQIEGANVGAYINLDFGDLAALSSLDRKLRETFLALTVDVEHFAKMKVLASVESRGEDGYGIVNGFTKALTGTAYDTPQVITESLNAAGMPRTKTRRAKLGNVRIA